MIILCADDYGLSPGVSQGILELGEARRLSAASAIVTFEDWPQWAERLGTLRSNMALGLHLNLTGGRPLTTPPAGLALARDGQFPGLGRLVRSALFKGLRLTALADEISAQIEQFRVHMAGLPDFIDGHQHVHGLPTIRAALIDAIAGFDWIAPPLVRLPFNTRGNRPRPSLKAGAVRALTRGLDGELARAGLPSNDTFAGFSNFDPAADCARELAAALADGGRCHLVMCHPGLADDRLAERDNVTVERRVNEFDALMNMPDLLQRIWHPERNPAGVIDWLECRAP